MQDVHNETGEQSKQMKLSDEVSMSSDPELVKPIVGTPWEPTLGRGARVLDREPPTATEPFVPEAELVGSTKFQTERTRSHSQTILPSPRGRITIVRIHRWMYLVQGCP